MRNRRFSQNWSQRPIESDIQINHDQINNGYCDMREYKWLNHDYNCKSAHWRSRVFYQKKLDWLMNQSFIIRNYSTYLLEGYDWKEISSYNILYHKIEVINNESWLDDQYVSVFERMDSSNGQVLSCGGNWLENVVAMDNAGFNPKLPPINGDTLVDSNGCTFKYNHIKNCQYEIQHNSETYCTNKILCPNRHIALDSQVGIATLDVHLVNSSGFNNDLVCSANTSISTDTFHWVHNSSEYDALEKSVQVDRLYTLHENAGTCQSHNSNTVYIDKPEFFFSQTFDDNFTLCIQDLNNSFILQEVNLDGPLFASTLINESTWLQDSPTNSCQHHSYNFFDTNKVAGRAMIERQYGFIPYTLPVIDHFEVGETIQFKPTAQWLNTITTKVRQYGVANYKGARIPVMSDLKVYNWRYLIKNYDYKILAEYIQFGFPLAIDYGKFSYNTNVSNHFSAMCREKGVDKYFQIETSKNAILGPFDNKPFEEMHFSPLMARDKPDGNVRVIVDLSWPIGQSVNSCTVPGVFDNVPFHLKYPSIDLLVQKINEIGPTALLYKIDLERAFRNLKIDPYDYPVLGLRWKQRMYVDVSVPFGFATGAASCQSCTDLVTWALRKCEIWVMSYLDDFLGVAQPHKATSEFLALKNLLEFLGLPLNVKKIEESAEEITCLGINVNARTGVLSIPNDKIVEVKELCLQWAHRATATRNQLQKLTGKLLYIHRCVEPARMFVNRILAVLRSAPMKGKVTLPPGFFKDIKWFNVFLEKFNGIVKIHENEFSNHEVYVDASLTRVGGIFNNKVYSTSIPEPILNVASIVHLEAANILIAFKIWAKYWKNSKLSIWCDNLAVVHAFTYHKVRDVWLMACVRNIWQFTASYNIKLEVKHIAGQENVYADILSRWNKYKDIPCVEVKYLKSCDWYNANADMLYPNFDI